MTARDKLEYSVLNNTVSNLQIKINKLSFKFQI